MMSRPSDDVFDVAGTAVSASPDGVGVEKVPPMVPPIAPATFSRDVPEYHNLLA
jgi:hypothetical protein